MSEQKEYFDEIAEAIESMEYYRDAVDWYQVKYLYPVIERTFFLFLTISSVVCSIISIVVLINFLPLTTHIPVAISNNDPVNEYITISKMTNDLDYSDADAVVQRYLLKKYIESFESYNYENNFERLISNKKFVADFSTPAISESYKFLISRRNPDSMRIRFREHTIKQAYVDKKKIKLTLIEKTMKTHTDEDGSTIEYPEYRMAANVDFVTTTLNKIGKAHKKVKARIDYVFSAITFISSTKEFLPLYFHVEDYQSVEIK